MMKFLFACSSILFALQVLAQSNPNESILKQQIASLKNQLNAIEKTIDTGDGKGRFSGAVSDSLYSMQDILMDLNDRLYWLTNKDSLLHANSNDEVPREDQLDKGNAEEMEEEKEIPMPKMDSMPNFDWGNFMKPKVKKRAVFFQLRFGASMMQDNSNVAAGLVAPSWQLKFPSHLGTALIYAIRLGKANDSKLKMEFNLKKKLTTSNFIKASPWQLRLGVGLHNYQVAEDKGLLLTKQSTTNSVEFTATNPKLDNNAIKTYYVHIPLTIWRSLGGAAFIEAGAFADILRLSKHTYKNNQDGISTTVTRRGNFGVAPFAYGATASIGYGAIAIFSNYQISSFFKNTDTYKYNLLSVGIRLGY
jgi:hypothetical protein